MTTGTKLTSVLLAIVLVAPLLAGACGKTVGDTIDDATITAQVKTALLNDPAVGGLKIDVDTFKGVVTLSGGVKTRQEEQTAIALARKVAGVTDVKSTLQVNPTVRLLRRAAACSRAPRLGRPRDPHRPSLRS